MSSTPSEESRSHFVALSAGVALAALLVGFGAWLVQLSRGLVVTGLSRDVSWGLYVSQFTFLVGVAASAVMVVVPYYLHDFRAFGRLLVYGEALAVAAVVGAGLFVLVDLGQPSRVMNVLLHPSPRSPMFWDLLALGGYLVINAVLAGTALWTERYGLGTPWWLRPLVYLSIPWAVSIHTITAFIYAGLPGRPSWETAVLAPRFLASAFASGPALLLLLVLAERGGAWTDDAPPDATGAPEPGSRVLRALARIIAWALALNAFLFGVELFTAIYSHHPEHSQALRALYLDPEGGLRFWMWASQATCLVAFVALLFPATLGDHRLLAAAAALAFAGIWMEKGMGLIPGGFLPSPLALVRGYAPTLLEVLISLGVWGASALVLTGALWTIRKVRAEGSRF